MTVILSLLMSFAFGQDNFRLMPGSMNVNGVSNNGLVVGYNGMISKFTIWDSETGQVTEIGGQSFQSSSGVSADGQYVAGTAIKRISSAIGWMRQQIDPYDYILTSMCFFYDEELDLDMGYIAGKSSTDGLDGELLVSLNGGYGWTSVWQDNHQNRGVDSMSFVSISTGYVCGLSGFFARTDDYGYTWTALDPTNGGAVRRWASVVFKDANNGLIGGNVDGNAVVYYTSDGAQSWGLGTGLSGTPVAIVHAGDDTYYLTTSIGVVQKSTNNGQSWTTVHTAPDGVLAGLHFMNPDTGYVVGEGNIYRTTDGGATWEAQSVGTDIIWNNVYCIDEQTVAVCGTSGKIYQTYDGGNTWHWTNEDTAISDINLHGIAQHENVLFVCGSGGNLYHRNIFDYVGEMARYDVPAGEWTTLGNLGTVIDGSLSLGKSISADGNTVTGYLWRDPQHHALATAWNDSEGFMNIGDDNISTQTVAVSHDGSVIAGGQYYNGSWKAALWRKNPAGGYYPFQPLLLDPSGSPDDAANLLSGASAVSSSGEWVGGIGVYDFNVQPWIWNETTGAIMLGNIGSDEDYMGHVLDIYHQGNTLIVIGIYIGLTVDAVPVTPFIWTQTNGLQNLNDYVTQTLGIDLDGMELITASAISTDGRYIAGQAYNPNLGSRTYILKVSDLSFADETIVPAALNLSSVYPNPFSFDAKIEYQLKESSPVTLSIYNQRGQLVKQLISEGKAAGTHTVSWDGRDAKGRKVTNGIYFARLNSGKESSLKKLIYIAK